jgi:AcrR family transcriptional regulator
VWEENLSATEKAAPTRDLPPRERILNAARALFYARGIRCVSVDEIAATAQTNKMTLYRHFESKDQLVAEYLRQLGRSWDDMVAHTERAHPGDASAQLKAWIEQTGCDLANSQDRGCPLANAAVELPEKDHPARAVIEEYKTKQREHLARLCRSAGYTDPDRLADEIFLLCEGSCVSIQSVGQRGPGARFTETALALLKSRAITAQPAG